MSSRHITTTNFISKPILLNKQRYLRYTKNIETNTIKYNKLSIVWSVVNLLKVYKEQIMLNIGTIGNWIRSTTSKKNDGYLTQASFASVNTLISEDEQDDTMLSMQSKKEDLNYKKNYQKTTHNSQ